MRARKRDHAAERVIAAGELFRGRLEQPCEGRPGIDRRVIENGEEPLARPLQIGARGLAIERFLAAERVIETRRADSHRGDQLVERRTLIAALPEQLHRFPQRDVAVEHRWPSPAALALLDFLPLNYFWCHRSNNP